VSAAAASAQSPQELPLLQPGNLTYLGSFTLPSNDGSGRTGEQASLQYGGAALGLGPDGQSLYYGCHAWHSMLAQVSIPAVGGAATIVTPCTRVTNLAGIDPDASESKVLGGSLSWNGRTIVSAYTFYDGRGNATASHFAGTSLSTLAGPYRLSGSGPGLVGGHMGVIPPEWRSLLGGPALTGLCCTSVISRSSYGPTLSVFDPDALGVQSPVPSTMLVGYPSAAVALGDWGGINGLFNGSTEIGGFAFPTGTRSILFVGRHGDNFCYGEGAACDDPTDSSKGNHAYPYRHQVWAYDANDLLAVKQGLRNPWQVKPYATWTLYGMSDDGGARMISAVYDPATRRFYVALGGGGTPRVHVYEVNTQVLTPAAGAPAARPLLGGRVDGTTVHFDLVPPLTSPGSDYVLEAGLGPGRADFVLPLGAVTRLSVPNVPHGRYYVRAREATPTSARRVSNEVVVTVGCAGPPSAPTALTTAINAGVVSFRWNDPDGCNGTSYRLAIGSAPGFAAAQAFTTASSQLSLALPAGTYYARVAAVSPFGTGQPSNEARFTITQPGCRPPTFRAALTSRVSQRTVRLKWSPVDPPLATTEDLATPISYVLEVGSAAKLANLIPALPLHRASTLLTQAPPGQYFVRVRAMNACGLGPASSDVRVVVP
jgi:hypothetical protein